MPTSPFADVRLAMAVSAVGVGGAATWAVGGNALPGGRWLLVHLLTLGVITPLVLAFSSHFSRVLTRSPVDADRLVLIAAAAAAVLLVGVVGGHRIAVAVGGTGLLAVVATSWWRIRRARRAALGARFGWIVRLYERAHGQFVHGALLGVALGTGLLPGPWWAAGRLAHLHAMVLGWAGLTVLATLVFFGPTIARARIIDGAEDRAAVALRRGAAGLSAAVLLLLGTGAGGPVGTAARLLAAAGLSVLAAAVVVVCRDVGRAVWSQRVGGWALVVGLCAWFPVVVLADVVVVATGRWAWLPPVGVAALLGVVGQAVLAALTHVGPLLRDRDDRVAALDRLAASAVLRAGAWSAGVVAVVTATALADGAGAVVGRIGWAVLAVTAGLTAGQVVWPSATTRAPGDPSTGRHR